MACHISNDNRKCRARTIIKVAYMTIYHLCLCHMLYTKQFGCSVFFFFFDFSFIFLYIFCVFSESEWWFTFFAFACVWFKRFHRHHCRCFGFSIFGFSSSILMLLLFCWPEMRTIQWRNLCFCVWVSYWTADVRITHYKRWARHRKCK